MNRNNISLMRIVSALLLFSAALVYQASADDAVGIRRIDVGTNSTVEIVMPFSPLHNSGPDGYLAGSFFGDGTDISDCLSFYDLETGESIDSLWADSFWLDPVTLTPSMISPVPGDIFYFSRSNLEPFSFYIYGRMPEVPFRSTAPKIKNVLIDPVATSVEFSVFTRGLTIDIFVADFNSDGDESPSWSRLTRYPASAPTVDFRDEISSMQSTRLYFAADATRDLDGDGLSDMMELLIYGTSPSSLDTDSDGLIDSLELAWGYNPLSHSGVTPMSVFSESFEPPKVVEGSLLDQNGWITDETYDWSVVDKGLVFEGVGALKLNNSYVEHSVTSAPQVVWVDSYIYAESGSSTSKVPEGLSAFFFFDDDGHPVVSDGEMLVTNYLYSVSAWKRWVRCTSRLDFATKKWDFYLDSVLVASNLSLRGSTDSLSALAVEGEGSVDNITVTTERPVGLSSDGDYLVDEWEITNFGDLSRDGSLDFDGDGLSDLEEFRAGTNPLLLNVDTDSDGLPDWWEIENGLNPTNAVYAKRIIFAETFESPEVVLGDINGQKEWAVTRSNLAVVQKSFTHDGSAALEMKGGKVENAENLELSHTSPSRADIVWMDVWCRAASGYDEADLTEGAFASFSFNDSGNPVLLDGDVLVTNTAVRIDDDRHWVRCSSRFDFSKRRWDFYLNGVLISEGLSMHGTTGSLNSFGVEGGSAWIDDVYIGVSRPMGLSSDGDAMPDEWEFKYFGDLTRDGSEDFDNDGLSDEDEALALTNPLLADTDGDGMSDVWEVENNLKPLDASDAALDPDGDGYSNLEEFKLLTNPWIADADGDGMLDIWEIKNGTNPFVADAFADPDGDGLVNIEEYLLGSEPVTIDSDGDGLCDYDEKMLGTNPDSNDNVSMGNEIPTTLNGRYFDLIVAEPESFAVTASLLQEWHDYSRVKGSPPAFNRIIFKIDGHFIGFKDVLFNPSNIVSTVFYTPVLPVGNHKLQIEWANPDFRARGDLVDVNINKIIGVDAEKIVKNRNNAPEVVSSRVSPVFVEGKAQFPWLISSSMGKVSVSGINKWYSYVPMTNMQEEVCITFEGLLSTNVIVHWESTDLFSGAEDIVIRPKDRLLFSGFPENYETGIVEVMTNGVVACSYLPEETSELQFCEAGTWYVQARWIDAQSGECITSHEMRVDCVGGAFPDFRPACQVEIPRNLPCPNISEDLFFESDPYTSFTINRDGSSSILVYDTRGDRMVAARLYKDGPVVDVLHIDPMWVVDSYGNVAYLMESNNGLDRCRTYMRQYGASDSIDFRIRSYASSVLFDDYTSEKWIKASAFDVNGIMWFEFLKTSSTASPCHSVEIYQNGIRIGMATYGDEMLPAELR